MSREEVSGKRFGGGEWGMVRVKRAYIQVYTPNGEY